MNALLRSFMRYIGRYTGLAIVANERTAAFEAGHISFPDVTFKLFTGAIDLARPYAQDPITYLFILF